MKNIFFFLVFTIQYAFAQDTICVTRSEMINYATNAIELKACEQNFLILNSDLNTCKTLLNESKKSISVQDSVITQQTLLLDAYMLQINQAERKKRTWRNISFSVIGSFILYVGIQILK